MMDLVASDAARCCRLATGCSPLDIVEHFPLPTLSQLVHRVQVGDGGGRRVNHRQCPVVHGGLDHQEDLLLGLGVVLDQPVHRISNLQKHEHSAERDGRSAGALTAVVCYGMDVHGVMGCRARDAPGCTALTSHPSTRL
jgi:hypothetical protein